MWKDKICLLYHSLVDLKDLHNKDSHYKLNVVIIDFGLSEPANGQKSDDKIYGVMSNLEWGIIYIIV
jgi:hypothetical protein